MTAPGPPADAVALPVAGTVLCGGSSRRMGRDKALIDLAGTPMAIRIADILTAGGCDPVFFTGGDRAALETPERPLLADAEPGGGPLHALVGALRHVATTSDRQLLVAVACDVPALDVATVRQLVEPAVADLVAGRQRVTVAVSPRPEPLIAVWPITALDSLGAVAATSRKMGDGVAAFDQRRVAVDAAVVRNVNDDADLAAYIGSLDGQ